MVEHFINMFVAKKKLRIRKCAFTSYGKLYKWHGEHRKCSFSLLNLIRHFKLKVLYIDCVIIIYWFWAFNKYIGSDISVSVKISIINKDHSIHCDSIMTALSGSMIKIPCCKIATCSSTFFLKGSNALFCNQ